MKSIGLRYHAYRPHRRWAVDSLDYAERLPADEKRWLEQFLREYYDADNDLLSPERHAARCGECKAGRPCKKQVLGRPLHRDAVVVAEEYLPRRWRRWWGKQLELWPPLCADWLNRHAGKQVAVWRDNRRECFRRQNYAYADVYSRGAVSLWEDLDRVDSEGNLAPSED